MKMNNLLIEKMEREAQASPLQKREDTTISPQDINKILETRNFLDVAMFYAEHNIKVFPVKRQDKKPLCASGFKSASMDIAQLQEWNKKFPDCNIGIPTGHINGLLVVDVDGEEGFKSLAQLEQQHGKLIAPTVITGKGKHLYFNMPVNTDIKSSVSKIANHIDIRANGGYVVAPPSLHENGHRYIWESFTTNQDFPEAPTWLISLMTNTEKQTLPVSGVLEEISNAPQGQRNDTLYKHSISLIARAKKGFLDMEEIKENIIDAAMLSGLSKEESIKTFDNALKFMEENCNTPADSEPDMDILKTKDLLPAPKLNTKYFKNIEPWVIQTAENTNAPVDYVAFSLLAGAAGVVGLSRTISTQTDWVQHCAIWLGIVGDPSSGKSPAIKPIRNILDMIEKERKPDYLKAYRQWEGAYAIAELKEKEWRKKIKKHPNENIERPDEAVFPEKPSPYHLLYGDTTQEAIAEELGRNVKGALVLRDELSGWIESMGRYSGSHSEKSFWLETFSGGKFIINRVKFGTDRQEIEDLMASVFGTIQPKKLRQTVFKDSGDGFLARFLWVYPEPIAPAIPKQKPSETLVYNTFKKLDGLMNPYKGNVEEQRKCLYLSNSAQSYFEQWYLPHIQKTRKEESKLNEFLGKGQGYVLRLALLFELLWWASSENEEPTEISLEAIKTAIELYDTYLTPMCERVYNMYYSPAQNIEARALARWIIENKPSSFTLREIYNNGTISNLRRKEQAQRAADKLIALGWLHSDSFRAGTTAGRKRTTYYVNPEVYELAKDL